MIYELLKKQVQQNTAFLNVYGRAKKQKKNEVTTNSFGTKLTKIIEFPLYDGIPLVPNANKKDLVFFERVGNVRDISDSYYSVLEEDFKVIVWLNKDTFDVSGKTYNGDIDIIVKELNRALISNKNSYILSIEFENATDENVFSSYTFSDAENAMTIEPFSAFELNYKIKYLASCNNLDSNIIVLNSECEPVGNQSNGKIYIGDTEVTIKNTTGETLYFESIPATQDREFEIQNSIYRVYNPQGKLLAEGEIPAEGVEEITVSLGFDDLPRIVNTEDKDVGHENDVTWIVEDSTVIIKNTEDTELYSVDVPAEDSREQVINDSQAIIKDSSGNVLKSENILAEGSKDITVQDSEVDVKNTTGATLYSESVLAEGSKDITVQDSEVEIKNSAGTTLYSENIPAEQSEELTIQDSTATIKDTDNNTLYFENILAEDNKDITIQDSSFTVKNSEDNVLNQSNILAQGSGEYTVQDSEVIIKDKFGNIIEQEDIPAEGSKEFTVNTELPVKNTEGNEVGTEINGEIIVGDTRFTLKDSAGNNLGTAEIPAEETREAILPDSTAIIKDSEGNTLKSVNILVVGSKDITIQDSEIVVKDTAGNIILDERLKAEESKVFITNQISRYSPCIIKFDTTKTGNRVVAFANQGKEFYFIIKDEVGNIVREGSSNIMSDTDTVPENGIYYLEIYGEYNDTEGIWFRIGGPSSSWIMKENVVEIVQWGDVLFKSIRQMWQGCINLEINPKDNINISDDFTPYAGQFADLKGIKTLDWATYLPWRNAANLNSFMNRTSILAPQIILDMKGVTTQNSVRFLTFTDDNEQPDRFWIFNMEEWTGWDDASIGSSVAVYGNALIEIEDFILFGVIRSTNMSRWRPQKGSSILNFFNNLGDVSNDSQQTITIRTQEWNLLTQEQKDVVEDILVNKNWALSLI